MDHCHDQGACGACDVIARLEYERSLLAQLVQQAEEHLVHLEERALDGLAPVPFAHARETEMGRRQLQAIDALLAEMLDHGELHAAFA